jgi:KDO2-lipid IV(A) lauroyltransferase
MLDRITYWAARAGAAFVQIVPVRAALAAARVLGAVTYAVDARHRRRAIANLEKAYGDALTPGAIRRIARGAFQHMFLVGVEMLHFRRIARPERWRRHVRWIRRDAVNEALCRGKGVIFVTGHVGTWEFASRAITQAGHAISVIARPIDNPLLEAFLLGLRSGGGQTVIAKAGALLAVARVARAGGILGFVADQSGGADGVFVDFFGRPASTVKSVAAMSLKFAMPIVTGCCYREGPLQFVAHADPPIYPEPTGDTAEDIRRLTQAYTANLEQHIRRHPDQWLWMHRRWRHRPDGTKER